MKALNQFDVCDFTEFNKDGDVVYENHFKRRKIFGIVVYQKRYRALSSRNRVNLQAGFKNR